MTAPAKVPRQMHCTCCGLTKPRKGCKTVASTGLVCAECVPELQPSAPKRGQRSPEGRQPAESKEAWRPYAVDPKLTEPAQPAGIASLPPGVKVTVRPTPRGRFEVDPATATSVFSALGPGRYLDGGRA